MSPSNYYHDGVITVTGTELKTASHTLYLDKVTSVEVASRTMGIMLVPIFLSLIPLGFFAFLFGGFMLKPVLILVVPFVVVCLAACYFRNSRVMLHTTGGNVIVAQKLGFGTHHEELQQFNALKRAIEKAKAGVPLPSR